MTDVLIELIRRIERLEKQLNRTAVTERGGGGGGGAPTDALYLALATAAGLTAERVFTPGPGLAGTDNGAGAAYDLVADLQATGGLDFYSGKIGVDVSDFAGAGLEDDGSENLRIAAAAAGTGLTGGGGSALALDINGLAAETTPDNSDTIAIYDATAGALRKQTRSNFLSGIGAEATITVKNTSGSTASANDVGYIDEAGEYKTTSTANENVAWCVVATGGANNADIEIVRAGRATVAYAGSDPSTGDFLVTSTTAGRAQQQTTMRPEIFAVCVADGDGSTVEALLLTNTVFVPFSSDYYVVRVNSASTSDFVAKINSAGSGGLTSTNVPYDTISSGAEDVIVPANQGGSELGRMRLYNSTRGTYRLITAVDTSLNKITTVASTDSWADNDDITIRSQTCNPGSVPYMIDVDLSQQSEIPLLARTLEVQVLKQETSTTANRSLRLHPWETYVAEKQIVTFAQAQNSFMGNGFSIGLITQRFCWSWNAGGTGTGTQLVQCVGYTLAVP